MEHLPQMGDGQRRKHVVFVLLAFSPGTLENFYERAYVQVDIAEELASSLWNATVVTRYSCDAQQRRNSVEYFFVKDRFAPFLRAWQGSIKLARMIRECKPDVVHVHGLIFPLQSLLIRLFLGRSVRLVGEYHADRIWSGPKAIIQKWGLRVFNAVIFANNADAKSWQHERSIPEGKIYSVPEASCRFSWASRSDSRMRTKLSGQPVFLWNSRLIERRDPLPVLDGFELAAPYMPEPHLYIMAPEADDQLLQQVCRKIQRSAVLSKTVTLVSGRRPHSEMEVIYNSSDYLLSGSRYDAFGYGAVDAMACGVLPIVTDIPTFRQITRAGEIGALWQVGDSQSLRDAIVSLYSKTYPQIEYHSQVAAKHFREELSLPAIANGLLESYLGETQSAEGSPSERS